MYTRNSSPAIRLHRFVGSKISRQMIEVIYKHDKPEPSTLVSCAKNLGRASDSRPVITMKSHVSPVFFNNIHIKFATNHAKSVAAQEPFKRILASQISELPIDSDRFGTFSGELDRAGSMLDALRSKVGLARGLTNERFILASEGSFSTASGFGLVAQNIELLMLSDLATGAEIIEQYITYETNYTTEVIKDLNALDRFLARISFGSHALVLYPDGLSPKQYVSKGIVDLAQARKIFTEYSALSPTASVMAMSDMRAHLNPTRMKAIKECCELMAKRLANKCPSCTSGGFGIVATIPGLPCEDCGAPTSLALSEKHNCPFCAFIKEYPRQDGKQTADSSACQWCNP